MNYGNNKIYCIYNARVHNFKPNTSFSFIYSRKKKKMASELEQRENRIINTANNYVRFYNGWLVEKQLRMCIKERGEDVFHLFKILVICHGRVTDEKYEKSWSGELLYHAKKSLMEAIQTNCFIKITNRKLIKADLRSEYMDDVLISFAVVR